MVTLSIGDKILSRGETGIVCNLDPPIMRTSPFISYVVFNFKAYELIESRVEPNIFVKPELIERVRRYLSITAIDSATGDA